LLLLLYCRWRLRAGDSRCCAVSHPLGCCSTALRNVHGDT
jgi:hypothetical protein